MTLERRLLATLLEPANIERVHDMGLAPKVFEEPLAAAVLEFVFAYWYETQMQTGPTKLAMETQFPGFILEIPPDLEDAGWLAEVLMKRYATNGVQRMVQTAAVTCHEDPIGTLRALMSDAYDASETILPRHSRSDMSENVEERRRRYSLREQGVGIGMTLGLPELDDMTQGILPGELCGLGAFSKVGKTMMLAHAAARAREKGFTPIIFSLEMPVEEIEDRMDAMFSRVSYNRLVRRKLDVPEIQRLHEAQTAAAALGRMRIESPDEGERTVAHLTARARHTGCDYLLIDQLSFMEETRSYPSEKQRQASILKQLKNEIGRGSRGKLACFLAIQLRRESLDRKEGPELRDFADAAEVERTCDLLLALSRTKEQRFNRQMRLDILGSRRSDIGSWVLRWDLIDTTEIKVLNAIVQNPTTPNAPAAPSAPAPLPFTPPRLPGPPTPPPG